MTDVNQDSLSDLLRQWAERHTPAEADVERLRHRVAQAVRSDALLDLPSPPVILFRCRGWGRALWFALGAAAATLVFMVVLRIADKEHSQEALRGGLADDVPASVGFAQPELAEKARLLAGMQDVFAGRLAWIGEAGREVQLGLLPDAASVARGSAPLAVRVVVLARKSGVSGWKPIWRADVIAQDEEVVDLAAESARDGTLRLWMHALPDGAIAVDANLALRGALGVRSSFSGIQRTGVPQRVFSSQTEDVEYQVYQTVAPLQTRESS
jgi:hypothetical protein